MVDGCSSSSVRTPVLPSCRKSEMKDGFGGNMADYERFVTRRPKEVGFGAEDIAMNLPRLPLATDNQVVIFTGLSKPNRVNLLDSVMDKQETLTPPYIVDSSLHYDSKSLATYWARSTTLSPKWTAKREESKMC